MNDSPVEQQYSARVGSKTHFRIGNSAKTLEAAFDESAGIIFHNTWHAGPVPNAPGWPHDPCDLFHNETSENSKQYPLAYHACRKRSDVPESNACDYFTAQNLIVGGCYELSDSWLYHMIQLKERRSGMPFNISWSPLGFPSVGFMAINVALQMCSSVDVYGFGMCGPPATPTLTNKETMQGQRYCRYFKANHTDGPQEHQIYLEHEIVNELKECNAVHIWM